MTSYRFKSFVLNVSERQLFRGDEPVPLTPKVFDTLVYLAEHAGHLAEKDAIMRGVWSDAIVEEGNLSRSIHTLRRALGEDDNGNKFIETVPTKGYRFVVPVEKRINGAANGNIPEEESAPNPDSITADPDELEQRASPRRWILATLGSIVGIVLVVMSISSGRVFPNLSFVDGRSIGTQNSEAYLSYKEGRLLLEKDRTPGNEKLLGYFDRAIELDPGFADAYAARAEVKLLSRNLPDDVAQARAAINKALELDPNSALAQFVQCRLKVTHDWDFAAAEKACKRSLELDSTNPQAHVEMAFMHTMYGRFDEAISEIDTAISIAPTSFNLYSRGWILFFARRYDDAIAQARAISGDDTAIKVALSIIARSSAMKGDYDAAVEAYLKMHEKDGVDPQKLATLRAKYVSDGWQPFVRDLIELIEKEKKSGSRGVAMAILYMELGDYDRVFENLERELKQRNVWMVQLLRWPQFEPLYGDPRFEDLVKRVGLK